MCGLEIKTELNDKTSSATYMVCVAVAFAVASLLPEWECRKGRSWCDGQMRQNEQAPNIFLSSLTYLSQQVFYQTTIIELGWAALSQTSSYQSVWPYIQCRSACSLIIFLYTKECKCPIPTWILDFRLLLVMSYTYLYRGKLHACVWYVHFLT